MSNVLMLTTDRQVDRRILLEAETLEAAGHTVRIIAMPLDHQTRVPDGITRIGCEAETKGAESFALRIYRHVRKYLPMNSPAMRSLKAVVWKYAFDQERFYLNLFVPAASKFQADIYMAHDLPVLPAAHLLSRRCNAKLVYDSHELFSEQEFSGYEKRKWAGIEAKYIRDCDAVITINPSIARELERRYGLHGVNVIYNAERTGGESPPKGTLFHDALGLAKDSRVLLFQGGLSAGRNLDVLVEAMARVNTPKLHLVFLGDGQYSEALRRIVSSRALEGRVLFHPAVPQSELLRYSACADAGIIPYQAICLNNYYCTPNKLFEFIAAGLPILASDLPEIRKIVQTHAVGQVGDLSTAETAAARIDDFFTDPQLLARWRDNAMAARHVVCWEREAEKLIAIFEALR